MVSGAARAASRRCALPTRGRLRVPGLAHDVVVMFDPHGIPHIRAQTDEDAFTAQGYCHGLHRFFQMDMMRRVLRGGLSAVVGERPLGRFSLPPFGSSGTTADTDRLMRTLDLVGAARRYYDTGDDEGRGLMDAYVRGVNRAVEMLRRCRPLEHRLLRLPLKPWTVIDSVLIAKGMALGLSFKWRTAPVFASLAAHLADRPELFTDILPNVPGAGDIAVSRLVEHGVERAFSFLPFASVATGSNAWLVGGGRSRSGAPLLANDPHLDLSLPPVWYLVSIRGGAYGAVGCSVPGLPGVVLGRTPHLAWGTTNGMIDDADLWAEDVDGPGKRYRVDGAWRRIEVETHEILRRGKAPLLMRLRRTHRGPIVSDAFPGYEGPPLSLRMTLQAPARDMETFLALARGRRAADVLPAVLQYGAPVQNLLYADTEGTAGYRLMGKVPLRDDHDQHPCLPRDGATSATDWHGFIDPVEMPAFEVGRDGEVVSANHPQADGAYPHYLSHLYEPQYRAERLHELLDGRRDLTIDDFSGMQMDAHNRAAAWFRELVLTPHAEEVRRTRPSLGTLLDRLLSWDGSEEPDAVGPPLWHLTYHYLVRRTFGTALGEDRLRQWMGLVNLVDTPLRRAFEDPESPWAPPRVRATLLLEALEDARKDLGRRGLGAESPWGAMHQLTLRHPVSVAPLFGAAFTRGPYPLRGGPFSVVSGQYLHPRPGPALVAASFRLVVDLADPERSSGMMMFGGQSGHVGSRHYDDLTPLWLEGKTLPMRLERDPERAVVLRLEPG
jgi:penicillin amidase